MPAIRSKRNDENIDPSQGDPFQIALIPEGSKAKKVKKSNKKKSPAVVNAPYGNCSAVKPKTGRPYTKNHPHLENRFEDLELLVPVLCEWPAHGVNCSDTEGHNPWECPARRPCGAPIPPTTHSMSKHLTDEHKQGLPSGLIQTQCRMPGCTVELQRRGLGRHVGESHYVLNKLMCLWCGVETRRSEYHNRHGLAARCKQRSSYLTRLASAQTPEAFQEGLDVLLQRGGDMIAIALLLLSVTPHHLWIGWLFFSAYQIDIFLFLDPSLRPLVMPLEVPSLAAGPSEPRSDQATIPT
ncbi:hypothetical protein VTO73DRAFT_10048 [Trametes versicolor]